MSEVLKEDFDIVGTAAGGRQALVAAAQLDPDAIVLDVNMPELNGFETITALKKTGSRAAVVFVSIVDDDAQISEAIRLGGRGYVLKSQIGSHLSEALDQVLHGRQFLPSVASWQEMNPPHGHAIHVFGSDASFAETVAGYVHTALLHGDAACFVAGDRVRADVRHRLRALRPTLTGAAANGRYLDVDSSEALNSFMRDGLPDPQRIKVMVEELDDFRRTVTDRPDSRLVIAGCLAGALAASGNREGALAVERIWSDVTRDRPFLTVCGYHRACFHGDDHAWWSTAAGEHDLVTHSHDH